MSIFQSEGAFFTRFDSNSLMRFMRFLAFVLACAFSLTLPVLAFAVSSIPGGNIIAPVSAGTAAGSTSLDKLNSAGFSVLHTAKVLVSGLAIIYLVYVGISMIMSSSDEGALAKSKKQLMYSLVAFLFVNIPGQIYSVFSGKNPYDVTSGITASSYTTVQKGGSNIFVNFLNWGVTVEDGILGFIRVALVGVAVLMFILAGFNLIGSAGSEEKVQGAKDKFLYGVVALVFMAIIQAWVTVVYSGDIPKGQGIFAQMANMALFFAGPTAIFFLILGAYYYITSAGEEERAKKGKSIVVNTFIAVIILLASYAFLKDLAEFTL